MNIEEKEIRQIIDDYLLKAFAEKYIAAEEEILLHVDPDAPKFEGFAAMVNSATTATPWPIDRILRQKGLLFGSFGRAFMEWQDRGCQLLPEIT